MKKLMFSLSLLAMASAAATMARAQEVILQIGPTTPYSTIDCANFTKTPDGLWLATRPVPFGLGFVHGIIPPRFPIKVGSYIYNNIDLGSQLNEQCKVAAPVVAKY